ncbi:MAG: TIGR00268 family protein, partial [Candidatus Eremiobacterota bacterium]
MDIHEKLNNMIEHLNGMGNLAVAFSGGVDSTFLLKVVADVLKD